LDVQIRAVGQQLRHTPVAGGAHHRPGRQFIQRHSSRANQDVARLGALRYRRQDQAGGSFGRQIFQGMHGGVHYPGPQGSFQLGGKQTLPADLGQGRFQVAIPLGGDHLLCAIQVLPMRS
jgi:hypothetical protein